MQSRDSSEQEAVASRAPRTKQSKSAIKPMSQAKRKKVETIPFTHVYKDHGWDQRELVYKIWKMEPGSERDALREQYDRIYGEDPNCIGWDCSVNLPDLFTITYHCDKPKDNRDLRLTFRAHMMFGVIFFLLFDLHGRSYPEEIVTRLYEPTVDFGGMEEIAYFRQEAVWPMFGSTKAFCEFLQLFAEDVVEWLFAFSEEEKRNHMTFDQLILLFEQMGDLDGVRLARVYQRLYKHHGNIMHRIMELYGDIKTILNY